MISIVIPTLNEEKYIERCLKSIKNQRIKNFETIVLDGG
jgi:glycosyltransferase EpsJ